MSDISNNTPPKKKKKKNYGRCAHGQNLVNMRPRFGSACLPDARSAREVGVQYSSTDINFPSAAEVVCAGQTRSQNQFLQSVEMIALVSFKKSAFSLFDCHSFICLFIYLFTVCLFVCWFFFVVFFGRGVGRANRKAVCLCIFKSKH